MHVSTKHAHETEARGNQFSNKLEYSYANEILIRVYVFVHVTFKAKVNKQLHG